MTGYAILLMLCLGPVKIAHETPISGYSVSENFVIHAPDQELSDELLAKSESLRKKLSLAWLGKEFPEGHEPCVVHVRLSPKEYVGWTWPKDDPAKHFHSVTIRSTRDNVVKHILAHELTHVVLATAFQDKLPRWVDEGIAAYQDSPDHFVVRHQILATAVRSKRWPALGDILNETKISADEPTFYAVSNSLVEFLMEASDSPVLFQFALDGKKNGWESAGRKHYGIRSQMELESRWRQWLTARHPHTNAVTIERAAK